MSIQRGKRNSRLQLFKWSCRPILLCMNFIGIPLNVSNGGLVKFSLTFVYSILLFSKETALTIFSLTQLFTEGSVWPHSEESSTVKWNIFINQLNDSITTFGTHFVLMSFTLVKWQDLVQILTYIEKINIFKQETYNKFNHICWWGFSIVILVNNFQTNF